MKVRTAVIPCAGLGTRWLPWTKAVPKELVPVGTRPAIQYVVEEAVAAGIGEIVLVCNRAKAAVADYFRPDAVLYQWLSRQGKAELRQELERIDALARITVVPQAEPRGLGDAIRCARGAVGDAPFCVILPDDLLFGSQPGTKRLLQVCTEQGGGGVILKRVPPAQLSRYGIIGGTAVGDGVWRITTLVEKPPPETAPSDLAIVGRYCFPPAIFPLLDAARPGALGEIQLTDAMQALAEREPFFGVEWRETVCDVGTPEGWRAAQEAVSSRMVS